jgi:hypothetical protein
VSDTLTSEVATASTTTWCRSKASKMARRKPDAPSMRAEVMRTRVIPILCATALIPAPAAAAPAASMRVDADSGAMELHTRTGMPRSTAGCSVRGCSTLAPK